MVIVLRIGAGDEAMAGEDIGEDSAAGEDAATGELAGIEVISPPGSETGVSLAEQTVVETAWDFTVVIGLVVYGYGES